MALVSNPKWLSVASTALLAGALAVPPLQAQSPSTSQTQQPAQQNIPDAPSAIQPPPPQDKLPQKPPATPDSTSSEPTSNAAQSGEQTQPPPAMPPVQTVPPGTTPGPNTATKEQLYKFVVSTNFVQVPVTVKDHDGRLVDGLLPKDFVVLENGKKQQLSFFSSDPFELSVAVVLDLGMPDVAVQKVNQTFPALIGAFSPYDEVSVYTYSSTVSQVTDYIGATQKLTVALDQMKTVRGHNNGPPVLGGPLGPQGPMINGIPVGGSAPPPVYTPPKEAHVLNDAILQAALDLSKRDKTRRKVIFVISDGRELGSKASYSDVLKLLLAQGIQVKAVAVEGAALPLYNKLGRLHLPGQGYSNILPKYSSATGGGEPYTELSRNAIEDAYAHITSEARNQYTLGYATRATVGSAAYRDIEVKVTRPSCRTHKEPCVNVYAKDGYYPAPAAR